MKLQERRARECCSLESNIFNQLLKQLSSSQKRSSLIYTTIIHMDTVLTRKGLTTTATTGKTITWMSGHHTETSVQSNSLGPCDICIPIVIFIYFTIHTHFLVCCDILYSFRIYYNVIALALYHIYMYIDLYWYWTINQFKFDVWIQYLLHVYLIPSDPLKFNFLLMILAWTFNLYKVRS